MVTWPFTGPEFEAAWLAMGHDRLPYPVVFRPPSVETEDDMYRIRRAAVESVQRRIDDELYQAMQALSRPDLRIEAHGFTGTGLSSELRSYVGIGEKDTAVLVQRPTSGRGGDLELTLCTSSEVSQLVVASLPDTPAGHMDDIKIAKNDLHSEPDTVGAPFHRRRTSSERLEAVFGRACEAWGEITVYLGAALDNRPAGDGLGFLWMDFTGDGRYYVKNDAYIQARPMGANKMVDTVDVYLRRVRAAPGRVAPPQ